jgi:hypothetical protein
MGFNVSALNAFNNELAGPMIGDVTFRGNTSEFVNVVEHVKYKTPLNLYSVDPYFQGGDTVSSTSGSTEFSQRDLITSKRTAYDAWNLQLLTQKYLGVSALPEGSYEDSINILSELGNDLVAKAQQENDDFIWNAVSGSTFANSTVVAEQDGFKTLISGSTTGVKVPAASQTGSAEFGASITAANAYNQITDGLALMDANVLDKDLIVWCGTAVFQRIVNGLVTQNLFHFDPAGVERSGTYYKVPLPGYPNVQIVGTWGLRSSDRVIIGPPSDMFIGTDLTSDTDNFRVWFSEDDDALKYRLRNKLGTNVGHPSYFASNDLNDIIV